MNKETIASFIRGCFYMCGGAALMGGWLTDQMLAEIIGAVSALLAAGWSIWAWRTARIIAVTNSREEVAGVIIKPTPDGFALANSIPSKTVVVSGTVDAAVVARS